MALAAICVMAGLLYGWRISASGWGNLYYSAAVKSMSASLTNFVFGSFDPIGVVTVDKPPMAFWPMVVSAAVFGYHGWSLLLPQVLEGVAAVWLLHRTVRRWAGEHVALLAALVFALTPVTVAINRDTNPDTLMVLLLVAAAYAFTRSVQPAVEPGRSHRWLLLAAMFLGLGFVTKMLQAWIVVLVFAVAYLVGSAAPLRRRVLDLLGSGVVLLGSSLWWIVLVSFWPGPKPYIGGSTDGSVLNLVIGYNGVGRILGREAGRELVGGASTSSNPGASHWVGGHPGGGGFGSGAGATRLFSNQLGGQISWLLPLCLLVLAAVVIAGVRQMRAGMLVDRARRAGWVPMGRLVVTDWAGAQCRPEWFPPVLHHRDGPRGRGGDRRRGGRDVASLPPPCRAALAAASGGCDVDRWLGLGAGIPRSLLERLAALRRRRYRGCRGGAAGHGSAVDDGGSGGGDSGCDRIALRSWRLVRGRCARPQRRRDGSVRSAGTLLGCRAGAVTGCNGCGPDCRPAHDPGVRPSPLRRHPHCAGSGGWREGC